MKRGLLPVKSPLPPELDGRSAAILREIVEEYVASGEPVGSRTLSRRLGLPLSPATIRNVMASLTEAGLLFSPTPPPGVCLRKKGCGCLWMACCNLAAFQKRSRPVLVGLWKRVGAPCRRR